MPESPRWLIQRTQFKEAEKIIVRIAKYNGKRFTDPSLIPRIYAADTERSAKIAEYSYLDLIRGKQMILRTMTIGFYWFCISEMYYGIIVMVNTFSGSVYVNSILSAASLYPIRLLSIPVMTW